MQIRAYVRTRHEHLVPLCTVPVPLRLVAFLHVCLGIGQELPCIKRLPSLGNNDRCSNASFWFTIPFSLNYTPYTVAIASLPMSLLFPVMPVATAYDTCSVLSHRVRSKSLRRERERGGRMDAPWKAATHHHRHTSAPIHSHHPSTPSPFPSLPTSGHL